MEIDKVYSTNAFKDYDDLSRLFIAEETSLPGFDTFH